MNKRIAVAVMALAVCTIVTPSMAHRYERATNDNPFRLLAYVANPIGLAVEYAVMRPIHWVVSQPNLDIVFGHEPTTRDDGKYFEWTHADYSPSIAEERREERANRPSEHDAKDHDSGKSAEKAHTDKKS